MAVRVNKPPKVMPRNLTVQESAVVRELYLRKNGMLEKGVKPTHAYVTVTREVVFTAATPDTRTERVIQPGSTLKIVMVSRFGDCGVTDHLEADYGYMARFQFDDPTIVDIRWQPTPTREWNEFLSEMIAKVPES